MKDLENGFSNHVVNLELEITSFFPINFGSVMDSHEIDIVGQLIFVGNYANRTHSAKVRLGPDGMSANKKNR